jgi:putative flippase GtrA
MLRSAYQGTVISIIVATIIYFALNALWTIYQGPALLAEMGAAALLGPVLTFGSARLYRRLFRR